MRIMALTSALCCLAVLLLGVGALPAWAEIDEIQKLDFGRWIVTRNDSSYSVTVQTDGSYTHSPQLILLSPPEPGIYTISELPDNTIINSVVVTMIQTLQGSGGQVFTMDNFQTIYPPSTSPTGEAGITLGGRALTSGNGQGYGDGNYSGELRIQINL